MSSVIQPLRRLRAHTFAFVRHKMLCQQILPPHATHLPIIRLFNTTTKGTMVQANSDYASMILEKNLMHRNHVSYTESQTLRCTVFDAQGTLVSPSMDIKRTELITKHGLFPRDIRKIDQTNHSFEIAPAISVRRTSILVSLLHIRCLIKADTVILFDDSGSRSSRAHSQFIAELESKLKSTQQSDLPYEIRALEAVLVSALANLDAEMKVNTTVTKGVLAELEEEITREKLRFLLIQNKKISTFAQKATLVRDVIDELLENDDDLAGMYLTAKKNGVPRSVDDHAEIEMLLESYYNHCDEIVQTINRVINNVRTSEEIINIILDSNRNQLMLLGLRFSIGLLSMGSGLFIAAAYGMNLENFIEETNYGFPLIISISTLTTILLFGYSVKHLNKLQKVTMMGEHYKSVRDNGF